MDKLFFNLSIHGCDFQAFCSVDCCYLTFKVLQQCLAAKHDVVVGRLEIARVPGIGDVAAVLGVLDRQEIEQQAHLVVDVGTKQAAEIGDIVPVHSDDEVGVVIHFACDALGHLVAAADAVDGQRAFGQRINRVANLLVRSGSGCNIDILRQPRRIDKTAQDKFSHRTAADVAVANEKDFQFCVIFHKFCTISH